MDPLGSQNSNFPMKKNVLFFKNRQVNVLKKTIKHDNALVMMWRCFGGTLMDDIINIEGILKKQQFLGNNTIS